MPDLKALLFSCSLSLSLSLYLYILFALFVIEVGRGHGPLPSYRRRALDALRGRDH